MNDPWFPSWAGGLIGGGVGLLGGIYGCLVGFCAPRGIARGLVVSFHFGGLALGIAMVIAAIVAFAIGQPYGVWYSLGLSGFITTLLLSVFTRLLFLQYRAAEMRVMTAKNLLE